MTLDESIVVIILFAPIIILAFLYVPMVMVSLTAMFFDWVIDCVKNLKRFVVARKPMKQKRPVKIKITNRHYDLYKPKEPQNVGGPTSPVMIKF